MSEWLRAMGPAVGNHLWQSTAFAGVVWVATLLLRKNAAWVRYGLWVAASVKFLVPFSLLIGLGGMLPRPRHAVVTMPVYSAVDEVGLPFSDVDLRVTAVAPTHVSEERSFDWLRTATSLPVVLAGVWLCGVVVVLGVWCGGWLKVKRTLRRAVRAEDGREVEILRRVEAAMGVRRVRLVLSREWMEPGIFGVFRPVLIWPEGLSARLDDEHVEAILTHELMHVRRRDNLTAALHMMVEAAFWFHPLVWWMERRMVEERERACDEAVVEMGSRPGVYAESLLKAVRFCVESPLVCVAGITGADLSKRVRSIMTLRLKKLSVVGKVALAALAFVAIAGPVAFGVVRMIPLYGQVFKAKGPLPSFDVVVIKPSQDTAHGGGLEGEQTHYTMTGKMLIQFAYGVWAPQQLTNYLKVVGGPEWVDTDVFDIVGKMTSTEFEQEQGMSRQQKHERIQLMEQSLLADRFKLKMHTGMQDQPVYALTVVRPGKLTPAGDATGTWRFNPFPSDIAPEGLTRGLVVSRTRAGLKMTAKGMPLGEVVNALMAQKEMRGQPVVDQTGLTGAYDFTLTWGPEEQAAVDSGDSGEATEPPLFLALQQQLGLKLVDSKAPAEVVVIDHIEKPVFDSAEAPAKPSIVDTVLTAGQRMLSSLVPAALVQEKGAVGATNPTRDDAAVTNGAPGSDGQKQELHGAYKVWLEQDVRWIITDQEAEAFKHLMNDEERDRFIEQYWQRRNPNPDAVENAYRDEIYARINYANENFASDQPGWKTDRGHIYIVYGKPDEIDVQPADSTQIWRYRYIPGVGDNVVLRFGDGERKGDYRLMTPMPLTEVGAQSPNPLKRRLMDAERMDGAEQANPSKQRLVGSAVIQSMPPGVVAPAAVAGTQTVVTTSAPVTQHPTFEVASVKPAPPDADPKTGLWSPPGIGRFTASHVSLALLIHLAYDVDDSEIANKPGWLDSNLYDVAAKPEDGVALTREELKPRLQDLLQRRFHLVVHTETRLSSGYALVVAKGGPHLTPTKSDHFPGYRLHVGSGDMRGFNWSMPQLAKYLTPAAGFPVVDQTGITGSYDIDFSYEPKPRADSSRPPLDVALNEATGLLLKSEKVPVETIVIDSVDKVPTAN